MSKPHKHAELIKAWADGAAIEHLDRGVWLETYRPHWSENISYRIKPEPKPDVVRYVMLNEWSGYPSLQSSCNAVITFDGETGKLKSVEVLK